jgi:3-oxoacyl-[acyl-carrier-protein] synthase II
VLSGGSEAAVTPLSVAAFNSMKALSTRVDAPEKASRPFDKDRDGFVLGEGSGLLLLEELGHAQARGARIYAEFLGYGSTADAFHITQPKEDGSDRAARWSWRSRWAAAGPRTSTTSTRTARARTSTTSSSPSRSTGSSASTPKKLAVSSTKSMIGHLLGGAAGIEAAVTCRSIQDGIVHPTRNHEVPGEGCNLDYVPGSSRKMSVRAAISNSLGFGGHNVCLLFGRVEG